ncbi:MAG: glycoside hydrolase family 2 protein [Solirubrobacteraceae bacterium]
MRTALIAAALAVATTATTATAQAQGPAYVPTPPSSHPVTTDGATGRYLLGGSWLSRADPGDAGRAQGWWRNVSATDGWSLTSIPNSYNAGDYSNPSMSGSVAWYRRDFTIPPKAFASYVAGRDRHWVIRFESVNYRATVWLNGRMIGSHTGAYLPFELDLTGVRSGVNRLIVRVDDRRSGSDLPPGPSGGWWNFGGILREVYLRTARRDDLSQVAVSPQLPCPTCAATIHATATVRNLTGKAQVVKLIGHYGNARLNFGSTLLHPRDAWTAEATAQLKHPSLWSPDHPSLYRAALTLSDAKGKRLGGYVTYSGVRSIAVASGGRLTLNGRLLNLRGVNIHEQALSQGAALDPAHLRQLVTWARGTGATIIRAHYPLSPVIEELADRLGLLIFSEVPVYQVSSQYLGQRAWRSAALATLQNNILANENHPSVLVWSIGNELETPPPGAEASYIAAAASLAHQLDPTRPVTMALSNWPGVACQAAYAPLDVLGVNEYIGWYDAGGGTTDDRDALGPWLDSLHACYPTKPLIVSEFGFEANRHGPVEERGTYEFQADAVAFHLSVFATKPWLSGVIYFPLQDFAVKPGWSGGNPWPSAPFLQKGVIDMFGATKPAYQVLSGSFHATQQIAPPRPSAGKRRSRAL